jgi:hypothetical protein
MITADHTRVRPHAAHVAASPARLADPPAGTPGVLTREQFNASLDRNTRKLAHLCSRLGLDFNATVIQTTMFRLKAIQALAAHGGTMTEADLKGLAVQARRDLRGANAGVGGASGAPRAS